MAHKFNAARRGKIPTQKHRVTNWASYNESLRRRGNLTVWIRREALSLGSRRGKGLTLPATRKTDRSDPVYLEVDSPGLKIFGASCIWGWTLSAVRVPVPI